MKTRRRSRRIKAVFRIKIAPHLPGWLIACWKFVGNLISEFRDKNCQKSAAALTYMTLFAIVPMMTVMYSMFLLVPAFDGVGEQVQSLIFSNLLPEAGNDLQSYLADFSSQARSLTGPGIAMLVVTAYIMLTNIEKTFNTIWGVAQARRGLLAFLLYWAVLTIGPILLGAGLAMSTYLLSIKTVVGYDVMSVTAPILRFLPFVTTGVAFTLLFAAVPNCRVPVRDALIGGFVTAVFFELAKLGFGAFVANSSFQLIYGAFATVPVFLIWLNLSWTIVLLGAVFVRTLAEKEYTATQRHDDFVAILLCLELLQEASQKGAQVSDRDCVRAGVGLVHWQHLRSMLVNKKWIVVTDTGYYVLSRDLKTLTLWDVASLVSMPVNTEVQVSGKNKQWLKHIETLQHAVKDESKKAMSQTLEQLYRQVQPVSANAESSAA